MSTPNAADTLGEMIAARDEIVSELAQFGHIPGRVVAIKRRLAATNEIIVNHLTYHIAGDAERAAMPVVEVAPWLREAEA